MMASSQDGERKPICSKRGFSLPSCPALCRPLRLRGFAQAEPSEPGDQFLNGVNSQRRGCVVEKEAPVANLGLLRTDAWTQGPYWAP